MLVKKADVDVQLLQQAIRGRPIDEALAYLRGTLPIETEPTLRVHPAWMKRVPWMMLRIAIIEEESAEEVSGVLPGP